MKTPEEIFAAMHEVCDAASKNGYTFCAALDTGERSHRIFCGNPILAIGLSGLISDEATKAIIRHNE